MGQARAVEQLQTAIGSGRLHHAFIFHGPAGVGKFTTAVAFAKLLLCQAPTTDLTGRPQACGTCEACRALARGMHPDLHVVTKELAQFSEDRDTRTRKLMTLPYQVLREHLVGPIMLRSTMGHGKVFIVDEAEMIDARGQNILLKTLEEPPPGTYLILVTSQLEKMLPTIRSRCQRVAFVPLADEVVATWLDQQGRDLTAAQRTWLVTFASGSLGRAAIGIEHQLWTWGETILPGVNNMAQGRFSIELGATVAKAIDTFAEAAVKGDKQASKSAANRLGASLMFSMLGQHARRKLADTAGKCNAADPVAADAALSPWLGVIDAIDVAERNLGANVNLALTCEHLVVTMSRCLAGAAR